MSESSKKIRARELPWGLALITLLILYVLSVGPFWSLALGNSGVIPRGMVYPIWGTVYMPLNWIAKTVPLIGDPLEIYINWWLPRGDFSFDTFL